MSNNRQKSAQTAALLFVFLAIGFLAGYYFASSTDDVSKKSGSAKLKKMLDLIDRMYVDSVNTDSIVDIVLKDLTNRLDPHSIYLTGDETDREHQELEGQYTGIGIAFSMIADTPMVTRVFEDGPAYGKLCPGDRIVKVDGRDMIFTPFDSIPSYIKGKQGTDVVLSVMRRPDTALRKIVITRQKVDIPSVIGYMAADSIGYIKISNFGRRTYDEFVNIATDLKMQGMEKLILDLRGNPGGVLGGVVKILDEFFDGKYLLCFLKSRDKVIQKCYSTPGGLLANVPTVVLIDYGSASASEILAGAMQDNDRAVIVGTHSFGKGLVQSEFDFDDGTSVRLTTARYYTPSGRSIQKSYDDYDFDRGNKLGENIVDTAFYKTANGRQVQGGGGVYPDIEIDDTLYSGYMDRVFELQFIDLYGYKFCRTVEADSILAFARREGYTGFAVLYSILSDLAPVEEAYKFYNAHSVIYSEALELLRKGNLSGILNPD